MNQQQRENLEFAIVDLKDAIRLIKALLRTNKKTMTLIEKNHGYNAYQINIDGYITNAQDRLSKALGDVSGEACESHEPVVSVCGRGEGTCNDCTLSRCMRHLD